MAKTRGKHTGFTVIELMVTVMVLATLVVVSYPAYQNYVRTGRMYDAQNAMLENVQALDQYYARHFSFKKSSHQWADFPNRNTQHFCIRMQGNPRGVSKNEDRFTMKAVAIDKNAESRVLVMNENRQIMVCERSMSRCDDGSDYFANPGRVDKNCVTA